MVNILTELIASLRDTWRTGDLRGHLQAWWWVIRHPYLLDTPIWE